MFNFFKTKYDFVKEISINSSDIFYYTTKNGWYVKGSGSYNLEIATNFFNEYVQNGGKFEKEFIIKSVIK